MSKWFHPNDYLIMFALVCHITSAIVCQLAIPSIYQIEELKLLTSHGGVPSQEQIESAGLYLKYQFALLLLLWTTLWTVKFSLLLFFWRMFDSVRTHAKIYWWIMLGATAATYITTIFIQLFACDSPVQFFVLGKIRQSIYGQYILTWIRGLFIRTAFVSVELGVPLFRRQRYRRRHTS